MSNSTGGVRVITVWRDFERSRRPRKFRTNNHKRKLSEFVCHLHKQNYFRAPHRVVTLTEWDVTDEAVELWARIRNLIAHTEADPRHGRKPMQPLFVYAGELDGIEPTHNNLVAAQRDLAAAVGMRAALSRSDSEKDLLFV